MIDITQFFGLTEIEARLLAGNNSVVFRVIKNGTGVFNLTEDNRPDRINVSILNGRVVGATVG